jgi:UDP-GlcNAc:undecaprenyl-phosphate GlcNAc-1-phosphate transferase
VLAVDLFGTLVMGLVTAWPYLRRGSNEPAR